MRTTLDIDDDVLGQLKSIASHSGESLGRAASRLIRAAIKEPTETVTTRNGLRLLSGPAQEVVGLEHVRDVLNEQ